MKKGGLCLAVALVMLLVCGSAAAASSGTCGEHLTWTLDRKGHLTIEGTGDMTDWTANNPSPWGINITSVTISPGVTRIGSFAFCGCDVLTEVQIPSTVKSLGRCCFAKCVNLASVEIPDGVETLEYGAFGTCLSLKEITLPQSAVSVTSEAFHTNWNETPVLQNIFVDDGNPRYYDIDGVLFERGSNTLVRFPDGRTGSYHVPEGTTFFDFASFLHSNIQYVYVPEGVTGIDGYAFQECYSLVSIFLPDSLTEIGRQGFLETRMETIVVPRGVKTIGDWAFAQGYPKNIVFMGHPESIGPNTFSRTNNRIYAYYNSADGWKDKELKDYGGKVLWIDYSDPSVVIPSLTPEPVPDTELVDATVKKLWDDGGNRDGSRPESLKVLLSNGIRVVLNEANGWTATVADLPKTAGGVPVEYTWTEIDPPEGYTLTETAVEGTVTTLTNRYTAGVTSATVIKVWNDSGNSGGKRPDRLTVALDNGFETVAVMTLDEANGWTATVADLPEYREDTPLTYTWTETEQPDGYRLTDIAVDGTVTTLTNSRTAVRIGKVDAVTGEALEGALMRILDSEGTVVEEWTSRKDIHEAEGLKAGETYTLTEAAPPDGYGAAAAIPFTVREDGTVETASRMTGDGALLMEDEPTAAVLRVTKRVTGEATDAGFLFTFTFTRDGEAAAFAWTVLDAENGVLSGGRGEGAAEILLQSGQTAAFTGLPRQVSYTVAEAENARYAVTAEGDGTVQRTGAVSGVLPDDGTAVEWIFTNSLRTRDVTVTKKWVGGRPGSDSVADYLTLYADGRAVPGAVFTRRGDDYTVSGLPVCGADGNEIRYTVKESAVDGYYAAAYTSADGRTLDAAEDGSTVTNEKIPYVPTGEIKVKKEWSGTAEGETLPDVTVDVYRLNADGTSAWVKQVTWSAAKIREHGGYIHAYGLNLNGTYYMTERVPAGYTVRYRNIGGRAGETDRAYDNGILTNHKIPRTGDGRPGEIWTAAAGVSLLGIALILFAAKRGKRRA